MVNKTIDINKKFEKKIFIVDIKLDIIANKTINVNKN